MALIEIIHFSAKAGDTIQKATNALEGVKNPQHFTIGTQIQNNNTIQITTEWSSVQDLATLQATPEHNSFLNTVRNSCGTSDSIFHVPLTRSAFGTDGPATAPVVEFVQSYFPTSRATAEFQKRIEEDFVRFDEIYREGVKGELGWAFGWVIEEQEHGGIEREKAKCLLVMRGWESMDCFEESVKHDKYKEAIPILFAWGAPWKMWHVDQKDINASRSSHDS
ncbi:hypothetical protein O988_06343 [Pseudogymnoascus sp. VKM F-3808]|nr:hypothetical protein O988_06343 [Pseudogymnoascus sp. VKM F-3808]